MPTIDADAHVVESERTWDYIDKADQKYRPLIVKPRGEGGGEYWYIDGKIRGLVRIVLDRAGCRGRGKAHRTRHEYAARNPRDGKRAGAAQAHGRARHRRASALPDHVHRADRRQARVGNPDQQRLQPLARRHSRAGPGTAALDLRLAAARHERGAGRAQILRGSTAPAASSCAASKASA